MSYVSQEIAISGLEFKDYKSNIKENKIVEKVIEEKIVENNIDDTEDIQVQPQVEELQKVDTKFPVQTNVIQANNLPENYNTLYKSVKIKNETDFNLSQDILTPNVEFSNKKDIIIFHTHTCESYTATKENSYVTSGNYRTTDLNYSVAKVGNVLEDGLKQKGFNVIHDITYHDYPSYNGSYSRSFNTVKNLLQKAPTSQLVIDLHRDAIGSMNNYAPSVEIEGEKVAQLMFVMGTSGGGLEHSNWNNNLKFAIKIQEKANEMYPGLFRPIILRKARYNQNLADSACIIEVGATGNTLEETTGAMKYLTEVIARVME